MPFRSRNNNRMRPIHSIKHVVDIQGGNVGGTQTVNTLVNAVDAPVLTSAEQIETGSRVNSIFLNVQVLPQSESALNNIYMYIIKNSGANLVTPLPDGNKVGISDYKKFIFHQEMAMLSDASDSIPITLFKGVLKIPRHMQRMGINDFIQLALFTEAAGNTQDFCIQCIYKEYR